MVAVDSTEIYLVNSLTVMAFDDGTPRLNGSTTVEVFVSDVNDKPPVFSEIIYNAEVLENEAEMESVIKVCSLPAN